MPAKETCTVTPRLAVITTHPIQYNAPLFRVLAERGRVDIHVFYGWEGAIHGALDPGFGRIIRWDIPLLDGYPYSLVPNESRDPGTHHFFGIASRKLIPAVRRWRPDAVLIIGWNYQSHLAAMRAFHGDIPVYFRGDSTILDDRPGLRRWMRRRWLKWVYSHIDVALYVGRNNRQYFLEHGVGESQLVWAPHSVENERFADPNGRYQHEALTWRRSLGIADDARTVVFAGKLEPKKAPDLLLEAFLRRRPTTMHDSEHLIFVGTGRLEADLRRRAAGRSDVHFLGFANQSRMPVVYRLGDVFALPSRGPGETWGLAINEAMACQRPVLTTDRVGCAADLVEGERTGLVVRADDVNALAAALAQLLDDGELRARLGKSGFTTIQSWSLAEQAARIEQSVEQRAYAAA